MKVPDNKAAVTSKPGTSYGSFLGPGCYSRKGCELIYVPSWLLFNKMETVHMATDPRCSSGSKGCHSCFSGNRSSRGNCLTTRTTITGVLLCRPGLCTRLSLLPDSTPNRMSHCVLRASSPEVLACDDRHPQQLLRMTCICLIVIPSLFH